MAYPADPSVSADQSAASRIAGRDRSQEAYGGRIGDCARRAGVGRGQSAGRVSGRASMRNRNPFHILTRALRLGQRHCQHAVLEGRAGALFIDFRRQGDAPLEARIRAFAIAPLLVVDFRALFAAQAKNVIIHLDFDVFLFQPWQLGGDPNFLVALDKLDIRLAQAFARGAGARSIRRRIAAPDSRGKGDPGIRAGHFAARRGAA
jgi:hypothetical protein